MKGMRGLRNQIRIGLAGLACCVFAVVAQAQSNQSVYGENLSNGWQDYSWSARDFAATEFAHTGSVSTRVTYTGGFQGFYLHHASFATAGFVRLEFWLHGGATNGRSIRLQALLHETAQTGVALNQYIEGGAVAAGQWRKVSVPLSALGAANKPDMTGFWLQEDTGSAQPAFYVDDIVLVAVPPPSALTVNVNAAAVRREVDARTFGINTAVWDADFNTAATANLLSGNQTKFLRFPGGSLSDEYHWQTNRTESSTYNWPTNFAAFANIAVNAQAQVIITANYGSGTPAEAAAWVQNANMVHHYGFKYWEIGNENYGSWEYDVHARKNGPYSYAFAVRDFMAQMKAVDPAIKIGVVVTTGEDEYANFTDHPALNPRTGQTHNGWTPVLLATLKTLNVRPDYIIYHKYPQNPGQESDDGLLQAASGWVNDAADLRQQMNDYLGAAAANSIEIISTEANSVSFNRKEFPDSLLRGFLIHPERV